MKNELSLKAPAASPIVMVSTKKKRANALSPTYPLAKPTSKKAGLSKTPT